MFDMRGKNVIVTGATKGIGAGIAELFAQCGANLAVVSRNQPACEARAKELEKAYGIHAYPHDCDIQQLASIETLVRDTIKALGSIDVLVNNAGTAITKAAVALTEADWDRVVDTNLKGGFFLCQAVGRHMIEQKRGKVINIASMFGLVGGKEILPYLASKGGLIQMTRGLALEWARYNIQVNAVAPGYVATALNSREFRDPAVRDRILAQIPAHRYGEVREIAGTVLFLASDDAGYITGAVYSVDGGWTAK